MKLPSWTINIDERILNFIFSLKKDNKPGRYFPCLKGATKEGKKIELGYSCFALKIFHMLGEWDNINKQQRMEWIKYIKSFQNTGMIFKSDKINETAFIDIPLIEYLIIHNARFSIKKLLKKLYRFPNNPRKFPNRVEQVIIAETKQALATLAEVGEHSNKPYNWFPKTPLAVTDYMGNFDWSNPWNAGGQTAALPVFFCLEANRLMSVHKVNELQDAAREFYKSVVDKNSGGYFFGSPPKHGRLTNGAMKVLTALDWLDERIHYPNQLIDTMLSKPPHADGCHVVDAIYVLHRCAAETNYKRQEIIYFFISVLNIINSHHNEDGGFSYYKEASQKSYYGLPISIGLNESDIHGTILMTWALAMIFDMIDQNIKWNIIRP